MRWTLQPGESARLVCSAEPIALADAVAKVDRQSIEAMTPSPPSVSWGEPTDTLLRAAGQFVLENCRA